MPCLKTVLSAFAVLLFATGASVASGSHDHQHEKAAATADGIGVLNSIDVPNSKVNISHEPVPAFDWPAMTMDLPVGHHVDLKSFKEGRKVQFTVAKGQDGVFRIMTMCPTDKDEVVEGLCPEGHGEEHGHEHGDHGDHGHGDHGHGDHGHDH